MKKLYLFLLPALCLISTGCEKAKENLEQGASEAVNAPTDYLRANVRAKQQAEVTTALSSVNNAVRMFQASEGRAPKSLNELISEGYMPALPALPSGVSYKYDARTGQVSVDGY